MALGKYILLCVSVMWSCCEIPLCVCHDWLLSYSCWSSGMDLYWHSFVYPPCCPEVMTRQDWWINKNNGFHGDALHWGILWKNKEIKPSLCKYGLRGHNQQRSGDAPENRLVIPRLVGNNLFPHSKAMGNINERSPVEPHSGSVLGRQCEPARRLDGSRNGVWASQCSCW